MARLSYSIQQNYPAEALIKLTTYIMDRDIIGEMLNKITL